MPAMNLTHFVNSVFWNKLFSALGTNLVALEQLIYKWTTPAVNLKDIAVVDDDAQFFR